MNQSQIGTEHTFGETHLECPKCHHHTIVQTDEESYACLNCSFKKRFDKAKAKDESDGFPVVLVVIMLILLLASGL